MPETMSPREKVAELIYDRLGMGSEDPSLEQVSADIVTALASGSGDHAELARLAEAASGSEWQTYISGRPEYKNVTHYIEQNPPRDLPFIAEVQKERDAAFIAAANPATVLALLAENAALRAENDVLEVERIGLRSAIFGSHDYDPGLRHVSFIEMARTTEDARRGAVARATEAKRKLADERLNYDGAMSDIDSLLTVLIRRINGEADLASAAEWVRLNYPIAAEAILSKEAERG